MNTNIKVGTITGQTGTYYNPQTDTITVILVAGKCAMVERLDEFTEVYSDGWSHVVAIVTHGIIHASTR